MRASERALRKVFPKGRPGKATETLLVLRNIIDPDRHLPDFLIIGGQRCGTSSLYKYLEDHPLIVPSLRKEIRYLSRHFAKGESWYRSHFASKWHRAWLTQRHGREPLTFEATPAYLIHPLAPVRANQLLPCARIVAILRNPIDRAYSHYNHSVRHGWEDLSFEEALEREPARLGGHAERLAADPSYHSVAYLRYSYATRGHYAQHLEPWLAAFGSDRLLVLRSEDLFERPVETYHHLLTFLGLPLWTPETLSNHSYGGSPRPERAEIPFGVREALGASFAPHNGRLGEIFGRDFGWDE